ncbi:MAG: amidohydrolase family protein [Betaproteobacteria bacterium]|jgi:imidazolonepropionase-like amidohydrolase
MTAPIRRLIRNARIWDGTGAEPFPGEVLICANRIERIARAPATLPTDGTEILDARGLTLMPGLVEGHAHLSFIELPRSVELGDTPPEEHTLATMHNARRLLDQGFTSAFSAASAKLRLDVVIRNEIAAGRIPGPRLRAASPEITVTGGLGDETRLHMARASFGLVADGADEIARAVRLCIREGVDTVKINISGDDAARARGDATVMREHEVRTAVEVAHDFGRRVASHSRASRSVIRAVDCGVDVIYHCEGADEEALDRLESVRDRIFCSPAIAPIHNALFEAEARGLPRNPAREADLARVLDQAQHTYAEMRRRGIPVVIGGDYGFVSTPQGENARDIELYVKLFGYSPCEALQCATRVGGALMGLAVGQIREGWLADLLLVHGDPLADVRILQNAANLALIMQDGRLHKNTVPAC